MMLNDGLIIFEGTAERAARVEGHRTFNRFCRSVLGRAGPRAGHKENSMPRTRSLKWSELKIGIMAVVAMFIAAALILALGGEGGFFWQRYNLKVKFSNAVAFK